MFKKIIVLIKQGLNLELEILKKIQTIFLGSEIKIISFDNFKKSDLEKIDLVITFGGDGTFIKAADLIDNSLIIGINSNPQKSEGALTSIDINEIDKLNLINLGNYDIIKKYRAKIKLNGKLIDEHPLNDIYVGTVSQFHCSRYKIKFKSYEEEHRSSGVIISTGTGSSAWFCSAGGEKFNHDDEKLGFIVREPYFGKRIFLPKLLKGYIEKEDKIIIESMRDYGGIIAISDAVYDFNKGDIVEIQLSDKLLNVIKLK